MGAGGHIVASSRLYGGSHNMFIHTLPRFGIETTLVDPRNPVNFAKAITPATRLVYAETLGNPGLEVLDIPAVADVAHGHGLPLMIDSTFTTPYLCRPIEHGCRHRHAFGDQVHRRPRHRHRRRCSSTAAASTGWRRTSSRRCRSPMPAITA